MIIILVMILLAAAFLFMKMRREARENKTLVHELHFSSLPEGFNGFTIFFISDIHKRIISETIIERVKGKVDIVVIGGDLAEKGVPLSRVRKNIESLKSIGKIYFVWGNNDYELDRRKFTGLLKELEVSILDNSNSVLHSSLGDSMYLIGIDDIAAGNPDLNAACSDADGFRILISHNPDIMAEMLGDSQADLILSGHTHGGQIRLFGYSPYKRGGIFKHEDTVQLISNGYGTTMIPLRLGAEAQTHLVTLKKDSLA